MYICLSNNNKHNIMTAFNQFQIDFNKYESIERCSISYDIYTCTPSKTRQLKRDTFDGRITNGAYQTKNK